MAGHRNDYGKRSNFQLDSPGSGGSKRRNPGEDSNQNTMGSEDTVYRYLCPARRIGSIIGKGGEIVKQLRSETKSNIRIGETLMGCEERVVTIYSNSEETNIFEETGEFISPAQDALFRVHDRIVAEEQIQADGEESEEVQEVVVRMLVPPDQIGCVIGKGGQVIQNIRNETHAQVRVIRDEYMPLCALRSDELLLIVGEPSAVRNALHLLASRLHENPSRSQHLLLTSSSNMYQSGGLFMNPNAAASAIGLHSDYWSSQRDEASAKEFSLRLVCPSENVGAVIGKGGVVIKQIRQESGASIKVDSSASEGDDCIIFVSAKEFFEDPSPTINAALLLQQRCSLKVERESGGDLITTRLLVPSSRTGCLIGKGGFIISEMRNATRAKILILSKDNLPSIASEDEDMVQITGGLDAASSALLRITSTLRANYFDRDGSFYKGMTDGPRYGNRDSPGHGQRHSSHSGRHGSSELSYGLSESGGRNV